MRRYIFPLLFPVMVLPGCQSLGFGSLPMEELTARYASAESGSKFLEIDGVRLHYRDEGSHDKPTLLLLHGVVSSLHTWDGWVAELKNDYRIIRIDVPGFGLTGPLPDGQYQPERIVGMIDQLLDKLEVQELSIAGNSLGGYMAWNYALKRPDRVEKLVLIDPAAYPMEKAPWVIAIADLPGARELAPLWIPKSVISMNVSDVYGQSWRIRDGVIDRYYDINRRPGNRAAMIDIFRMINNLNDPAQDPSEQIAQISTPTLLMWGDKDRWIPPSQAQQWQRDLPSLTLKMYPDIGHVPMEEIPVQSAWDAKRFLQQGSL